MKNIAYICMIFVFFAGAQIVFADAKFQIEQVNNNESLPRIEIKENISQEKEFKPSITKQAEVKKKQRPVFNPKKNSGMTNYQYDDTYYKYNKYEKYIEDNINYSKSGSTKLY